MIRIIDYGLGNIQALQNMYKRLNVEVETARSAEELESATKLILPGVGAFDHAMELLGASGMRRTLDDLVQSRRVPVLGICVGMQILARSSAEGRASGLGWIEGDVKAFAATGKSSLQLPHMGWNDVRPIDRSPLFKGLEADARFYFLHSFYFHCDRAADIAAVSAYGLEFCSAIHSGNIFGVQFHPEKSHHFGSRLLQNFAEF